jgi:uncharacterized membrane protein YccC
MFKILLFPFWILKKGTVAILSVLLILVNIAGGICRFLFGRVFSSVFGALIGGLLGRKHIGVKVFKK